MLWRKERGICGRCVVLKTLERYRQQLPPIDGIDSLQNPARQSGDPEFLDSVEAYKAD